MAIILKAVGNGGNDMEKYIEMKEDALKAIDERFMDFVPTDVDMEIIQEIVRMNKNQYDRCFKIFIYGGIRQD